MVLALDLFDFEKLHLRLGHLGIGVGGLEKLSLPLVKLDRRKIGPVDVIGLVSFQKLLFDFFTAFLFANDGGVILVKRRALIHVLDKDILVALIVLF